MNIIIRLLLVTITVFGSSSTTTTTTSAYLVQQQRLNHAPQQQQLLLLSPVQQQRSSSSSLSRRCVLLFGVGKVDLETIRDIGFVVTIEKPMGVVFGENRAPFNGIAIDVVNSDSHGDVAGLKIGDQLLAVNDKSVIGYDFDRALSSIKNANSPVELQFYRGSIKSLFTIVINRRSDSDEQGTVDDDDDDDDDYDDDDVSDDEIIMDENYESPVIMSADDFEDDTISVGQVAGDAVKGLGTMLNPTKIGGFFGKMFTQETIQLDDEDGK